MTQEKLQVNIDMIDNNDNKTLSDYIIFLQNNGFHKEADFYINDVCNLLKQYGDESCHYPLNMLTKDVITNLYLINDALQSTISSLKKGGDVWEVELCR